MLSYSRAGAALCRMLSSALQAALIVGVALLQPAIVQWVEAAETPGTGTTEQKEFSAAELDEIVGPIALYPDELLAITLPASTYPLQIVQAARLLEKRKTQPDLQPEEDWDASVIGLMNYPEVVNLMNDDLDWTWKLGEAVADQQADVMDAIQRFRGTAADAGNLESNEQVSVATETEGDQQIIVVESASPEVIYVPTYQPSTVVVQQPAPVVVYSNPYPYYYRPAAAFWTGMFVGAAVGWGMRWGYGYRGSSINVNRNVNVNVNRPTRPSSPNRPSQGPRGGGKWQADRGPGSQVGGRPGRENRPGASQRPATQERRGGGRDAARGGGARDAKRASGRDARPSTGQHARGAGDRAAGSRASGRDLTSPSRSSRGSGSSLGRYGSGSHSRAHASRGASSRGGGRGGGHRGGGRGGGGRGGGGRGGRR